MKISIRWLSWFLIGYMLLAFGWWAVHLWQVNDRLFAAERAFLEIRFTRKNIGLNETAFLQTSEYKTLEAGWRKRRRMIVAEGLFFSACLMVGLYVINRSTQQEIAITRQRRNFMLSITHELKSPLASIRLIFDTLAKRSLDREQTDKLSSSGLREAARLQELVESLLLAARLENDWRPLREPIDLAALVRDCTSSLATRFPMVDIRAQIEEGFAPVQADKQGLTSVILNLLENALKYSPEGSPIIVKAERQQGRLRISVMDQGQGIPDGQKKSVFEKFYRLGNELTRQSKGTGLGLYIVKQVVLAHGGAIYLTDNQPKGTIFTIEL